MRVHTRFGPCATAAASLVAVALWPGIFAAATAPRWWVIAITLPLWSRIDPRDLDPRAAFVLALFLLSAAASATWSVDPAGGALDLLKLTILAGVMAGAAGLPRLAPIMVGFGWGVALSGVLALAQLAGFGPIRQPTGLFLNPEVLAETAAIPLVWAAFSRRWALAGFLAGPLVLCGSRVALLAAAVGLLAGLPWPRRAKVAAASSLIIAGALSMLMFGPGKFHSALDRMVLWGAGLLSLTWTGHGLGWWAATHPAPFQDVAHSDVLQLLVEVGPAAMLLFAFSALAMRLGRDDAPERAALAAGIMECAVSFPLHLPASGFVVAALAGWLARRSADVRVAEPAGGGDAARGVRSGGYGAGARRVGARRAGGISARPEPAADGALCARPGAAGVVHREMIRWV